MYGDQQTQRQKRSGKFRRKKILKADLEKMFWFKLAARLGMSVARCRLEVDMEEFNDWTIYNQIDPIGDDRQDFLFASLQAFHYNINRRKNSAAKASSYFLTKWSPDEPRQTGEEMHNALLGMALMHNIPVKRG
jgi:hypothetical protein